MRRLVLTIGATIIAASPAAAIDARFERTLRMLAPAERLEQLCDYTAMQQIRKEHKSFRPDRVVAGAGADPQIQERTHTVVAKSAAFRSRKKWYALSYSCTAAVDHMAVTSFSYSLGEEIPESKWASYGLWD